MVPYLRAANVKDGLLDLSDVKSMNFDPKEQERFALRPGDVLVTEGSGSLSAVGASAVWQGELSGVICFQNTLLRLRPRPSTDPRFLGWWCRYAFADGLFASIATGANIHHVSAERVRALPMVYSALPQQRAIADYLDTETARIDALITKKRRLIELLDERRRRAERCATLESEAPLFPMRWTATVGSGDGLSAAEIIDDPTAKTPVIGGNGVMGYTTRQSRMRKPSIAVGRVGALCGNVHLVDPPAWVTDNALWVRNIRGFDREYLATSLRAADLNASAERTAQPLITGETIKRMSVPRPSIAEQQEIATRLRESDERTKLIVSSLRTQIDLLAEHRQAFITAAVTGEFEIPVAA